MKQSKDKSTITTDPVISNPGSNNYWQHKVIGRAHSKVLLISILVVATVSISVLWFLKIDKQSDNVNVQDNSVSIPEPTVTDSANMQARAGDLDGAYANMDKAIGSQDSIDTKQELAINKALIAYNSQDYESALSFAKDAEIIKEGLAVSQVIARAAGKLGNTSLAVQYWQKVITQLDPDDMYYSDDKASAESAIQQLKDGTWK